MSDQAETVITDFVVVSGGDAFRVAEQVVATNQTDPESLRRLVRDRFGLDVVLLHDGGLGFGLSTGQVIFETQDRVIRWRSKCAVPEVPNARAWQQPGWYVQVLDWLRSHGIAVKTLEQVSTNDLSCVLKVNHSMYFKASDHPLETALTHVIADALPGIAPVLVAADSTQNWFVTQHSGQRLNDATKLEHWLMAARKLGQLHREGPAGRLIQAGGAQELFSGFLGRVARLMLDPMALEQQGLQAIEIRALEAVFPRLESIYAHVVALGLTECVTHGDAHPMNALQAHDNVVWFDWAEARVMHPLLDVGWFLARLEDASNHEIRRQHPELMDLVWRSYVDALGEQTAMDLRLEAVALGWVQRAMQFQDQSPRPLTIPGLRPKGVLMCMRQLLRLFESEPQLRSQ